MTTNAICERHLEDAFTSEARNHIRSLHLADLADAAGDPELAAVLREQAVQEDLHATRLYELASGDGIDLVTDEPVRDRDEILAAALEYARCQADETSPWRASQARREGCDEIAAWFDRHVEACREQIRRLEALRG
jgi:rubrerythrin